MKPTDLQIADWVLIDNTPRQVVQLTKSKVGYHTEPNECRMHYARYADVEPIPITAEILEKNEIKNDCVSRWHEWIGENAKILFNPYYLFSTIESKDVTIRGRFDYVHQLQQAIRLCGIDKQIKL